MAITKPFVDLLRLVDSEKFVIGKVYWYFSKAIHFAKEDSQFSAREKSQIVAAANARWVQLHTPLHGVAFALEPKF